MQQVFDFLKCLTPDDWLDYAVQNIDTLLIDHAHCEKKAASSALQLISRYVERAELLDTMSQLAREELLHFEQVLSLMRTHNIKFQHLTASKYAQNLRMHIRKPEPFHLCDFLIVGAIIEARSCERFYALAEHLSAADLYPDLSRYYRYLLKSESRHFLDYLELAHLYSTEPLAERIEELLVIEAKYLQAPDKVFRFHSGLPVVSR